MASWKQEMTENGHNEGVCVSNEACGGKVDAVSRLWPWRAHDGAVYTLVVVGQIKCIAQAVNEKPPNSRPTWLHTSIPPSARSVY